MKIEIHVLQQVGPNNLNRDETGMPKSCWFGNTMRARVSSQCWKAAMRRQFANGPLKENLGIRTALVHQSAANILAERGHDDETALKVITALMASQKLKIKDKRGEYLLFIPSDAAQRLADIANDNWDVLTTHVAKQGRSKETKTDDETKKASKKLVIPGLEDDLSWMDNRRCVDIAMFGRMLSDLPSKSISGCVQVAHAIGVNEAFMQSDYYSGMDDLSTDPGAAMIGHIDYSSDLFYRYAAISVDGLLENLGGDADLTMMGVRSFIDAFITSMPSGKQNSFAAFNAPGFAMTVVRDYENWNLSNAFSPAVTDTNLMESAARRLLTEFSILSRGYDTHGPIKSVNLFTSTQWLQREQLSAIATVNPIGTFSGLIEATTPETILETA